MEALRVLLRPDSSGKLPLQSPLPLVGEGSGLPMAICRIVAEIRTRACMVMALYLEDPSFASAFVQSSGAAVDALKCLAKECAPVHRHRVVEMRCHRLRMLYRDCAKPPPPPNRSSGRSREITWNTTRAFPPVRASLFSHGLTGITFLGDPSAGSGLPRGTFIYASHTVPLHAPSFYWELEVCSLGDPQEDGGPVLSFGFAPPAERKDGAWTNPVGTVLFHNNGRAVHYNGSSLLQWRSVRLDVTLAAGDVAGCGWERTGDTPELMAQSPKGTVFFTYNGQRLSAALEDVAGGMWPVVHLQKKNTRVKSNFGARPFAYAEGRHHIDAAHEASESAKEIRATFGILPFPGCSDSESDVGERTSITTPGGGCGAGDSPDAPSPPMVPPCRIPLAPRPCREYDMASSSLYRLQPSYSNLLTTGPDHQHLTTPQSQDDESDTEDIEDVRQQEDHYALLVKAWESRVFPVIRRRFRNEAERKDGLEQIRGALQLGMTDIAQQTVEFLYEENGGVPRDLHLPTIEDIKDEVSRFTMERIRKGTPVVVRHPSSGSSTTTVLPKFAVRAMLKTFGLPGIVLDVDNHNELVQVETYLRSEGVLVRFWYPLDVLERPAQDLRRTAVTGVQIVDTNSVQVHRELIRLERALARIYCRSALLRLVKYCESPEVSGGAIVPFFSELDVENLRLLSDRLLASSASSCRGSVLERSLTTCGSPKRAFAADSCLPSDLFHEDALSLQTELASTIYRVACHGEDYLMELTDQISSVVQLAPESFPREEMGTVESKTATDVHFPGASFLFVSVKGDPKAASISKRESSPPPSLQSRSSSSSSWARIYCYSGNDFKKNGRASRREVACYPRSSSVPNVDDPFLPLLLDCDCIHVRLSCRPPPGAALVIHAIPPQFPLALAYFEELLKVKRKELCSDVGYDQAGFLSPLVTSTVLLRVIELIGGYLWRTDVTPRLKECVFHLLAEYLRTTRDTNGTINGGSSLFSALGPQLSPSLALMLQLQSELRRLYDEESRTWTVSQVHQSSSGDHQQLRFSSYFHALMEVSLAIAEVTAPLGTPFLSGTSDSLGSRFLSGSPPPLASLSVVPSSPSSSSRRKKLKAKRDRDRASPKSRSCSSSPRGSVCETDQQPGPSGASLTVTDVSGSSKPEDALWFHRAVAMSEILRCLIDSGQQESSGIKDAVADAFQALVQSTAHSRLVVITGIPRHLSVEAVNQAIVGGLRDVGGIRGGEVYVPRTERDDTIGDIVRHRGDQRMGESSRNAGEDGTRRTAGDGNGDKQNRGFAVFETRSKAVVSMIT